MLLLLSLLFSVEGRGQGTLPQLSLSCSPATVGPEDTVYVAVDIRPGTDPDTKVDSDLSVPLTATHTARAGLRTFSNLYSAVVKKGRSATRSGDRGRLLVHRLAVNGIVTVSVSPPPSGYTGGSCQYTVTGGVDPPPPPRELVFSKTRVRVAEAGGTGTYTVKLTSRPTGNVTVRLASVDENVATVDPSSLMFTTTSWDNAKTVTVTGVDDKVDSDRRTRITHRASGGGYASVSGSVTVSLTDDDTRGVTVSKASLTLAEAGGAGTYTVKLESEPTGTVTIGVSSRNEMVATARPSRLTFDASDWSGAKTVTVTGVDDKVDSDRRTNITHAVSGADYGSVRAGAVAVTLTDDDEKGVTLSTDSLTVAEGGGTGTYTVVLDSEPTGTVTVRVASQQTSTATVSPGRLTFSTTNWHMPKIVTVTGAGSGGTSTTITHTVSGSDYAMVTAGTLAVTLKNVTIDLSVSDAS
ncbi:MAG: hypothetical protein OXS35_03130, partial [Dehalococcoidia bacterium]|nr:hypothetical protein [Dehalococcoidia bacterium]